MDIARRSRGSEEDREKRMEEWRSADTKWEFENPDKVLLERKFKYLTRNLGFYRNDLTPDEQKLFADFYDFLWPKAGEQTRELRIKLNDNPIGGRLADFQPIEAIKDEVEKTYTKMFELRNSMGFEEENIS